MTAEFFALAIAAAINPSLLAVDLALVVNRRPTPMFACVLLGGLSMAIAVGLAYVLVSNGDAVQGAGGLGAGAHLGIGLALLILAALLFTGRLHRRQRKPDGAAAKGKDKDGWTQRALREPRFGLAVGVGALLGTPGGIYLTALHRLAKGNSTTAVKVTAVILFAIIEFALIIIPLVFLVVRPERTEALVKGMQGWLVRNGRRVGAYAALVAGAYLTIDALVSLLS